MLYIKLIFQLIEGCDSKRQMGGSKTNGSINFCLNSRQYQCIESETNALWEIMSRIRDNLELKISFFRLDVLAEPLTPYPNKNQQCMKDVALMYLSKEGSLKLT